MPERPPNRVLREMVDIHYFGGRDGLAIRNQLEDLCSQRLNRVIDETLESWGVPNDQLASIDRLEIDITGISTSSLESDLIPKIVAALKRALHAKIGPPGSVKAEALRPVAYSVFEQLMFFLERGHLPWSCDAGPDWSEAVADALRKLDPAWHEPLIDQLKNPESRRRYIRHFPEQTITPVLAALWSGVSGQEFRADVETMLNQLREIPDYSLLREQWLYILVTHAATSPTRTRTSDVCDSLVQELDRYAPNFQFTNLAIHSPALLQSFKRRMQRGHESREPQSLERTKTESEGEIVSPDKSQLSSDEVSAAKTTTANADIDTNQKEFAGIDPTAPQRGSQRKPLERTLTGGKDSIYIRNAGLVILAPYLPTLFQKLELLEDRRIRDIPTALCLTHYLVFATDHCAEWDLVLNKILCGIGLRTSIETVPVLLPEQKAEADRLLAAVIANWPALKNTSPTGLRNTFLQREGALRFEGKSWQLRLTRGPFDVLMDQLPWTISMIQLPWMPSMLHTDWAS